MESTFTTKLLKDLRNQIFESDYIIYYIDTNIEYKSLTYKRLFVYNIKQQRSIDITHSLATIMKLHITKRGLLNHLVEIEEKIRILNSMLYQKEQKIQLYSFIL